MSNELEDKSVDFINRALYATMTVVLLIIFITIVSRTINKIEKEDKNDKNDIINQETN